MYRELGFETTDGNAYGAVSGYALTIPNSGHFSMVLPPTAHTSYDPPPPPQQQQAPPAPPPQHAPYPSSRYHPYAPPPSYGAGHSAHAGYSSLAAR